MQPVFMKKIVSVLLFLSVVVGFSQEKIVLRGEIVFSSMNISSINIVNVSTHQGTINNAEGEFKIEVRLGDELLFSSVQYEDYRLAITQEIIDKRWVQVELIPAVNELAPVTISNINLTGNLKTDLNAVEIEKYYDNESFGLPKPAPKLTVEERRLYTATSGGPVGFFANAISGRLKKLKKIKKNAEFERFIEKAAQSLPAKFFVSTCGIPEEYLASFLYFCAEDKGNRFKTMVRQGEDLKLVVFFKNKAKIFKQQRKEVLK